MLNLNLNLDHANAYFYFYFSLGFYFSAGFFAWQNFKANIRPPFGNTWIPVAG